MTHECRAGASLSGVIIKRRGPFAPGDQVQLTDEKGRRHRLVLTAGRSFHTHRGSIAHDDLIGMDEGSVVRASGGTLYVALRPLLADYTRVHVARRDGRLPEGRRPDRRPRRHLPRRPGARGRRRVRGAVLLAAARHRRGRAACLLRAHGPTSPPWPRRNVEGYFGGPHPAWRLIVGLPRPACHADAGRDPRAASLPQATATPTRSPGLRPGRARHARPVGARGRRGELARPGGLICCYVATTTQLSRVVEALRGHGGFVEPAAWESMQRGWHVEGLAVRPEHRMVGHTGFLVTARRLAPGVTAPPRRRRPAKGAHPGRRSRRRPGRPTRQG